MCFLWTPLWNFPIDMWTPLMWILRLSLDLWCFGLKLPNIAICYFCIFGNSFYLVLCLCSFQLCTMQAKFNTLFVRSRLGLLEVIFALRLVIVFWWPMRLTDREGKGHQSPVLSSLGGEETLTSLVCSQNISSSKKSPRSAYWWTHSEAICQLLTQQQTIYD